MKILLSIHHFLDPDSGAPGATFRIGEQLRNLGHEVQIFSFDDLPSWLPNIAKKLLFPWFLASRVLKLSKYNAIDVLDASTGDAWVWCRWGRKKEGKPLVVTRSYGLEQMAHLRNLAEARKGELRLNWRYPIYHGGWRLREVASSLRCADLVFQMNTRDLKFAVETMRVSQEKSAVVPYGLPDSFLNQPIKPLAEDQVIRIAQIGTFIPRKGIQYSVPAINALLLRYPNLAVGFLGTGVDSSVVVNGFDESVRERVHVVPEYAHGELPILLQDYQIQLFASLSEGFGFTLLEGMACGLAPVATDIPGPSDFIINGENGLLIPSAQSGAIQSALEKLVVDRVYLETMRKAALESVQHYSWQRCAQEYITLYKKGLARLQVSAEL